MKETKLLSYVVLAAVLAVIVGLYVGLRFVRPEYGFKVEVPENPRGEQVALRVGDETLQVEVRDTDEGRALGLSGRAELADGEGMLFVFEEPGQPLFWMKNMLIAIDIVWIRNGRVLEVDEELKPPTEESPRIQTAAPPDTVEMVLELPGGYVERSGIQVGDEVELGSE